MKHERPRLAPIVSRKIGIAKPQRLLFNRRDAAAVLGVNEHLFAKLVRDGLINVTRLPGSGDKQLRRYSIESLKDAVRKMTEDCHGPVRETNV